MKLYKSIMTVAAGALMVCATSCNDYDYDAQLKRTDLTGTFTVMSTTGNVYKSAIDGNTITIKVNPFVDGNSELNGAVPTFFLPMGATCSPDPSLPQDFSKEVKYTITSGDGKHSQVYTVTWGDSDPLPEGEGYAYSKVLSEKCYPELGYPGKMDDYYGQSKPALYGDLMLFLGFCGDKLVGFSRQYGWGNYNDGKNIAPEPELAFKVWNSETLEEEGKLNLGEVKSTEVVNITNDWKGHLIAVTGGKNSKPSDVYYWTSLTSAPVKVGTLPTPVYTNTHEEDASMFISVAGDITGDAAISYMPKKTATGDHVIVYVRGGAINQTARTISTGYPSNTPSYFQMISLFGADENVPYIVGYVEGTGNGAIKAAYNSPSHLTLATMPAYFNGKFWSDGIQCWAATGAPSSRGGMRRPFMMAMMMNGKPYSMCLTGYDWGQYTVNMTGDFSEFCDDALTYDTRAKRQAYCGSGGLNAIWSFGCHGAWYWNAEANEGRVAIWTARTGVTTFLVSSYE